MLGPATDIFHTKLWGMNTFRDVEGIAKGFGNQSTTEGGEDEAQIFERVKSLPNQLGK